MRALLLLAISAVPLVAQIAPPNDLGVSMGHLYIVTPDPAAHRKAWVDVLGGQSIAAGGLELVRFPGVFVIFREGESSGGSGGTVVDHLGFMVKDGAALRARLRAANIEIVREMPETRQFFAMFPGDLRVEFTEEPGLDGPIAHHHVHFASHQVEEMRAWYGKVFGAPLGMRGRFPAADVPGANLSWNRAAEPTLPTRGRTLQHIGFEVKDIDGFCKRLEAAGIALEMQPAYRQGPKLTIAFLTDPWGTRIQLTEGLAAY